MRHCVNSLLLPAGFALLLSGCAHLNSASSSESNKISVAATSVADKSSNNSAIMEGKATTDALPLNTLSTALTLQELIKAKKIDELRTSYNGMYGASLLFHADTLTYYVALFQRNDFWRVIKTDNAAQAEKAFTVFTANTRELAKADIERIQLQAEHRYMEKQLAVRANELDALRSDLAIQQQHERAIAAHQQRTIAEASRLTEQQASVQSQLRALQHQIQSLEAQKNRIDQDIDLYME